MFAYPRKKYYHYKYRQFSNWKPMLANVTNPEQFGVMMNAMFDDDVFTEQRFLVLECFTLDLCRLRRSNVYYDLFVEFKGKCYHNVC